MNDMNAFDLEVNKCCDLLLLLDMVHTLQDTCGGRKHITIHIRSTIHIVWRLMR